MKMTLETEESRVPSLTPEGVSGSREEKEPNTRVQEEEENEEAPEEVEEEEQSEEEGESATPFGGKSVVAEFIENLIYMGVYVYTVKPL